MNGSVFFPFFFFRYHYTKGADAAGTETAASLLTTTLRGTTTRSEKTLRFQASLQAEWSQNNLPFIRDIRGHSNPGNRFFSSSFFIYFHLFFLPSFLPSFLSSFLSTDFLFRRFWHVSVFRRAIIFAAWRPLTGDNASSAFSGRGKRAN